MLSVEQACEIILKVIEPASGEVVPLVEANELVLTEEVRSDADSPPFDKALMDGYAVRSADCHEGIREFQIAGEVLAGQAPDRPVAKGSAVRIMTGAPIPPAADCVIPFERSRDLGNGRVVLEVERAKSGGNLARRGESLRRGDLVVAPGALLGPAQIGALAEMGKAAVCVIPRPLVAVLATGDELVPADAIPGPGQIRNSNEVMLTAQCRQAGASPVPLGIARDSRDELRTAILQGFAADFLCLSGGVSAGQRDLVPSVLADLGAENLFHGCDVKPGKPIWFGRLPAQRAPDSRPHWIFGLPGNPVSSMVCFELFVRTAIRRRRGIVPALPTLVHAVLTKSHVSTDSRPTFFPAAVTLTSDGFQATPLNWKGSFDLQSTAGANALIRFSEPREFAAGEQVSVLPLGRSVGGV